MASPANLILIQSDNHSRKILGCYDHEIVKTPTLDKLASRGIRFANAYTASPLCVPARAAMATGRFPHQTGYWDNAIAYDARIPSWMHRIREQGHTVIGIGKFHYRSSDQDNGFSEEFLGMHLHGGRGAVRNLLRGFDSELPGVDDARWDLYAKRSGPGGSHYQDYDQQITRKAIEWLREHAAASAKPWAVVIGYACPHPPFAAPKRLFDLYPEDRMPLPHRFRPGDRPEHPAVRHKRWIERTHDMTDERTLRRIAAAYFALVTYLDENVAEVMQVVEELGLLATTRIIYTSDHGELFGAHGLLGKSSLYEASVGVPLILCGPGIPENQVTDTLVSHVDLFPTVIDAAGARILPADAELRGRSLFDTIDRREPSRVAFSEYHAQSSKAGQFMLRDGDLKLVYHVGMPPQLFDLSRDPDEIHDLVEEGCGGGNTRALETKLRTICDPEEVDARAKLDQRLMADYWGGQAKLQGEEIILFTPPPGVSSQDAWASERDKANVKS